MKSCEPHELYEDFNEAFKIPSPESAVQTSDMPVDHRRLLDIRKQARIAGDKIAENTARLIAKRLGMVATPSSPEGEKELRCPYKR